MATNNSVQIAISSEDKRNNSKPLETNENNPININIDRNNINNKQEDIEELPPYYKLFIYSDTGSCIYKLKKY